jgi:hypothetical protein
MIAREMANHFSLSMRDCLRYFMEVEGIISFSFETWNSRALVLLSGGLAPIIAIIKLIDSQLYRRILEGSGFNQLADIAYESQTFKDFLGICLEEDKDYIEQSSAAGVSAENYLMAIYDAVFKPSEKPSAIAILLGGNFPEQLKKKLFGMDNYC